MPEPTNSSQNLDPINASPSLVGSRENTLLNWSQCPSPLEIQTNVLTTIQRQLYGSLDIKINNRTGSPHFKYWSSQDVNNDYGGTASIVIRCDGPRFYDFIQCGYKRFGCGDRFYCPRCTARYALDLKGEFQSAVSQDNPSWYLVCGLSDNPDEGARIKLIDSNRCDYEQLKRPRFSEPVDTGHYGIPLSSTDAIFVSRYLLEMFRGAVKEHTGPGKIFSGSIIAPEVALRFLPIRILPHVNVIAWAPALNLDDLRDVRRSISKQMRDSRRLPKGIYPTIYAQRIPTGEDLARVADYIMKPMNLGGPYVRAAELVHFDPIQMTQLNIEAERVVRAIPVMWTKLRRIERFGVCFSKSKNYIGFVTDSKKRQREREKARRIEKKKRDQYYDIKFGVVTTKPRRRSKKRVRLEMIDTEMLSRLEHPPIPPRTPRFLQLHGSNEK